MPLLPITYHLQLCGPDGEREQKCMGDFDRDCADIAQRGTLNLTLKVMLC